MWVVGVVIESGARQQALSEFLSLIEGRDLLLTHADKQIRHLRRKLDEKQASCTVHSQLLVLYTFLIISHFVS